MKQSKFHPAWYLLLSLGAVVLDQLTKWLCVAYLKPVGSVTLIPGLLRLTYLENTGAAFGMLSDHRWVFLVFSTLAIVGMTVFLVRLSENNRLLRWTVALLIGGGVGNMIDRTVLGYVVDMIDFYGIWPYIFNVADSFVCVSAGMLVLYCLLSLRDERRAGKTTESEQTDEAGDGDGGQP